MAAKVKIKLVFERKPEPPPLASFRCVACEEEVERDPYHPEWERAPICNHCNWRQSNRLQTRQLPFEFWPEFRRFYSVLAALEKEIKRARCTN